MHVMILLDYARVMMDNTVPLVVVQIVMTFVKHVLVVLLMNVDHVLMDTTLMVLLVQNVIVHA